MANVPLLRHTIAIEQQIYSLRASLPPHFYRRILRLIHDVRNSTSYQQIVDIITPAITWMKDHPYLTAAIIGLLVIAIVLMANPVGAAGFGAAGVVAGEFSLVFRCLRA